MNAESLPPHETENPYQSWEFQDETYQTVATPPAGFRPGGLTTVCIIAIVLGALGLLGGLSGLAMSLVGNQVQQWQAGLGTAGVPAEMAKMQTEMNTSMMAVTDRFRNVSLATAVFRLGVAAALLWGAIQVSW